MCKFYCSQLCGLSMESYMNDVGICIACPHETKIQVKENMQQVLLYDKRNYKFFGYYNDSKVIIPLKDGDYEIPDEEVDFIFKS